MLRFPFTHGEEPNEDIRRKSPFFVDGGHISWITLSLCSVLTLWANFDVSVTTAVQL